MFSDSGIARGGCGFTVATACWSSGTKLTVDVIWNVTVELGSAPVGNVHVAVRKHTFAYRICAWKGRRPGGPAGGPAGREMDRGRLTDGRACARAGARPGR
eukprot:351970-Chlamydomonas_euryale.AAC.1